MIIVKIKSMFVLAVLVMSVIAITLSGCLDSYTGTYINSGNPKSNLTIYPDHTYRIYPDNPKHVWSGSYRVEGDEIVLVGILGEPYPLKMQGNKLIQKNGNEWIRKD